MLNTLATITVLSSLLLILPAFITAFLILKEYKNSSIRLSSYYKFLLLQGFIHSFFLVLALFFPDFKTAFLIHSFAMIPLYALLLFRKYALKSQRNARLEAERLYKLPPKRKISKPSIDPARLKGIRLVGKRKSQWH